MLYVLPPSEWNWRDGEACAAAKPLAAIGIKKMTKSYVKTLPSKSSMSSCNLKIQDSFCDNSSSGCEVGEHARTYNTLTVLTLSNGKEITFDVQKNHNSTSSTATAATLQKRKRSNTFIEISTQKLKDDDDDDVNFKKSKSS